MSTRKPTRKIGWFWYTARPVRTAMDARFSFFRRKRLVEAMDSLVASIPNGETLTGRATLTKIKHYRQAIAKIDTALGRWLDKLMETERATKRRRKRPS